MVSLFQTGNVASRPSLTCNKPASVEKRRKNSDTLFLSYHQWALTICNLSHYNKERQGWHIISLNNAPWVFITVHHYCAMHSNLIHHWLDGVFGCWVSFERFWVSLCFRFVVPRRGETLRMSGLQSVWQKNDYDTLPHPRDRGDCTTTASSPPKIVLYIQMSSDTTWKDFLF